jgi:hypothetical protein
VDKINTQRVKFFEWTFHNREIWPRKTKNCRIFIDISTFNDDELNFLFKLFQKTLHDFEFLKIDICGKKIGISYVEGNSESISNSSSSSSNSNNVIKYNFLDLFSASWSFVSFQDFP